MKYLITGISIIVLSLVMCLCTVGLVDRYTGQTVQELRLAQQAITEGEDQEAADYAARALELWRRHSGFFGAILYHSEMDEINVHFAQLQANAEGKNHDEFHTTCAELITLVDHLPQMEKAYYFNIL